MDNKAFLQSGWPFKPVFRNKGSEIEGLDYHEDIRESIEILFTTLPGERIAHPTYGCDLLKYMFKPINNSLLSEMEHTIHTAIVLYESRIELLKITVKANGFVRHQLDIDITYNLSKTNSRYNMTIPFYTMEAGAE